MEGPRQTRRLWTREEDDKLKHFKKKYPNLSWPAIAKKAELNRTGKSCWERWEYNLRPDINKGEFSPQEDELIIHLKSLGVSWASMEKYPLLRGRAHNALKNRWNNHLVKRLISDLERHLLTDDETSDHSVGGDDLEASTSGSADLIPNHDPNALHSIMETYTR